MKRFGLFLCGVVAGMGLFCGSAGAESLEQSLGFGVGLPYGGLGANYELAVNDYFAPTVGLGLLPDNLGWNLGARLYFPGRDASLRGRLTVLYGTNTLIERQNWLSDSDYDTEEGFSEGLGFNWRFGKSWAFDADLFVVQSNPPEGAEKKGGDVKVSFGFSHRW